MRSVTVVTKDRQQDGQLPVECVECNLPPSTATTSPKGEIRLSLLCVYSLLMSLGINMQKRGLHGKGRREGKKEAIKDSHGPQLDYKSLSVSIAAVAETV